MNIGAWKSFKNSWKQQTAMQLTTLSVLIGGFSVICISALVHQNMQRMLTHWGEDVRVNVYLKEEATEEEKNKISSHLSSIDIFKDVQLVSKKEAAEKFKKRVSEYVPGLLSDIEFDNPLPSSFEMVVKGGLSTGGEFDNLVKIANEIRALIGVDEVSYGQGWIENYASVLKVFSITSIAFILILLSGSLFVIGNSIRNSISQRRDEIEIMELCGATHKMIVWPYIFEGLAMGFAASLFAIVTTFILYRWHSGLVSAELTFWNFTANLEFLSALRIISILALGTGLGGLGSYLWIRKVSTGWAAAEANVKV